MVQRALRLALAALMACIPLCAARGSPAQQDGGRYLLNVQESLSGNVIPGDGHGQVPVLVSWLNDPGAAMDWGEVLSQPFTPSQSRVYPGFYKGVLYVDVAFSPYALGGGQFVLSLGDEAIDFAEAFALQPDGSVRFMGRTGRMLFYPQMSVPTWRPCIPFSGQGSALAVSQDGLYHIVLRMQAYVGAPVAVSVLPARVFALRTQARLIAIFFLLGIHAVLAAFVLGYGIVAKDRLYILLGLGAVLFLLLMLQQKGVGPTYFWNALSSIPHSPRLGYYFGAAAFTFFFIDFILIARRSRLFSVSSRLIPLVITTTVAFFAFCAVVRSPVVVYVAYSVVSVVLALWGCVTLTASLVRKKTVLGRDVRLVTVSWDAASLLVATSQLFRLVRVRYPVLPFTVFDHDGFFVGDVTYALLVLPSVASAIGRLRRKNSRAYQRLRRFTQKTEEQSQSLALFASAAKELLNMSNVILNTVRLPLSTQRKAVEDSRALVEAAALHSAEILNALGVLSGGTPPESRPILLAPFFDGCMNVVQTRTGRSATDLGATCDVAKGTVVFANEYLLELMLTGFILAVLRNCPREGPLSIRLYELGGRFCCSVQASQAGGFVPYQDFARGDGIDARLSQYTERLYGARADSKVLSNGVRHTLSFELEKAPLNGREEPLLRSSHEGKAGQPGTGTLTGEPPRISPYAQEPLILLLEPAAESRRMFSTLIGGQARLMQATSAQEGLALLAGGSPTLPDIIITEYDLPDADGIAFVSGCAKDARLRNIPVIVIVSSQSAALRQQLVGVGAVAVLVRPFKIEELFLAIFQTLSIAKKAKDSVMESLQSAMSGTHAEFHAEFGAAGGRKNSAKTEAPRKQARADGLSKREAQIAELVVAGKSDKEIATELGISAGTVATHNKAIFKKLGIHSRVELITKMR